MEQQGKVARTDLDMLVLREYMFNSCLGPEEDCSQKNAKEISLQYITEVMK